MRTEYYDGYLKPQDLSTGFGVTIRRDGGCNFLFSVLCADIDEAEAVEARRTLQALVPHLRQSFDYYRRHPDHAASGLEPGGYSSGPGARGIVRLGPGARVLSADAQAVHLAEQSGCLSIGPFERFSCASSAILDYIEAELAAWGGGGSPPSTRTFHLRRGNGALPLRVTVFRPGGSGLVFFRGPECVVLIEDPAEGLRPAVEEFTRLYGLTDAEQRIAEGLAAGYSLREIAGQGGTSLGTVRTQMKSIAAKTSLNRQVDLVRHICIMAGAMRST